MIEYIVKYQNNFVSSFLFSKNLPKLMQKGINVQDLMASSIFSRFANLSRKGSTSKSVVTFANVYRESSIS